MGLAQCNGSAQCEHKRGRRLDGFRRSRPAQMAAALAERNRGLTQSRAAVPGQKTPDSSYVPNDETRRNPISLGRRHHGTVDDN